MKIFDSRRQKSNQIIRECVNCQRQDTKPLTVIVAPLPLNRTQDAAIFEVIEIDFAGPLVLKDVKISWICIITCVLFTGVHFELVNSLNTPSLFMSFRQFIARRGRPSTVYSDSGTNFHGLNNNLKM